MIPWWAHLAPLIDHGAVFGDDDLYNDDDHCNDDDDDDVDDDSLVGHTSHL